MPLYEYSCEACGEESELLVRGSEHVACPACGSEDLTRLMSAPAAHTGSMGDLPICQPPRGSGCGLPQCGMGGCMSD